MACTMHDLAHVGTSEQFIAFLFTVESKHLSKYPEDMNMLETINSTKSSQRYKYVISQLISDKFSSTDLPPKFKNSKWKNEKQ